MPLLLAPVLAQLVTLNLGARAEARYVAPAQYHYQELDRGLLGLNFGWEHTQLTLAYSPQLLLAHLGASPVEVLVSHLASATVTTEIQRATVSFSEIASYGKIDPTADALGGPQLAAPPDAGTPSTGGTTGTGTSTGAGTGTGNGTGTGGAGTAGTGTAGAPAGAAGNGLQAVPQRGVFKVESLTSAAGVAYRFSLADSGGVDAYYTVGGGADAHSRAIYPRFQSVRLALSWIRRSTPADTISSAIYTSYGWSADGTTAWISGLTESWVHAFSPLTLGRAGIGFSASRGELANGTSQTAVYPTFDLLLTHSEPLARGMLVIGGGASSAPAFDPISGAVDPRLGVAAGVAWSRERFSIGISGTSTVSVGGAGNRGAQNFVGAQFRTGYQIADAIAVDGGLRAAWQTYQSQTVVPPSYAAFVGLTFGGAVHVAGR